MAQMEYTTLPDDLPVPQDDGAADHLPGLELPVTHLLSTAGHHVDLSNLSGKAVVFAYPRTGRPGEPLPLGWDAIPGARGCTPQSCAFRDQYAQLQALGIEHVFGLSSQDTAYQQEVAARLELPFLLLSDPTLSFAHQVRLPTFAVENMVLLKRLTMIIDEGCISHVIYPVFPPHESPNQVIAYLSGLASR